MEDRKILVLHGPNLNMLGKREPAVYGSTTLAEIDGDLKEAGKALGIQVDTFQSNHEGALVEKIQEALGVYDGLIINPAAFTHTSVALRDAILMLGVPVIEIHISNIYAREPFRHTSMIAGAATAQISGCGIHGYTLALEAISNMISNSD